MQLVLQARKVCRVLPEQMVLLAQPAHKAYREYRVFKAILV